MTKNDDHRKKLTAKQRKAVPAVVTTKTAREAAIKAECSESSVYKWLQDPAFKAEVVTYETMIRDAIRYQLVDGAKEAADVIRNIMSGTVRDEDNLRASVRLRAALGWLDLVVRTQTDTDVERRLSELEKAR